MPRKTINNPDYFGPQVYIAVNKVDGMKYIGKTIKSFNIRHRYRDASHDFSVAYHNEPENWDVKVIPCKSEAEANKLEYEKVTNWHVRSRKYYNKTTGGQGGTVESRALAKEYRKKQAEIEKLKAHETRFNSHQKLYEKHLADLRLKKAKRKALPKRIIFSFIDFILNPYVFWGMIALLFLSNKMN